MLYGEPFQFCSESPFYATRIFRPIIVLPLGLCIRTLFVASPMSFITLIAMNLFCSIFSISPCYAAKSFTVILDRFAISNIDGMSAVRWAFPICSRYPLYVMCVCSLNLRTNCSIQPVGIPRLLERVMKNNMPLMPCFSRSPFDAVHHSMDLEVIVVVVCFASFLVFLTIATTSPIKLLPLSRSTPS